MAYYDSISELDTDLTGAGLRVGIVMSRFNEEISQALLSTCVTTLSKLEVNRSDVLLVTVPGALEIPITLQKLAVSGRFDALIALGAIVRGDTYHFEVVANESANGLMSVQLDTGVPIVNGILTTDNDDQAVQRTSEKGAEIARAAIEMANLMKKLNEK